MNKAEDNNYFNTNEYVDYLIKNFDVDESPAGCGDSYCKRPDLDLIMMHLDELGLKQNDEVLEIGCGLGRLMKHVQMRYGVNCQGVDASLQAIEIARKKVPSLASAIRHGYAESLPFKDAQFDLVVCWGVFDLTSQGDALPEMIRILKTGGKVIITGKSDSYCLDDKDARLAEVRSQEKGIPNHFTNYDVFLESVMLNGAVVVSEKFYVKRGDFVSNSFVINRPARFYEYCVVLEKKVHRRKSILAVGLTKSKVVEIYV